MRWQTDRDDMVVRRAAKARLAAIKAREDARAYREHMAMCEPEEPLFRSSWRQEWQDAAD